MKYIPKLIDKEIEENHIQFSKRASLYKKRGLDFVKGREFILEKASFVEGTILEIGTGTGHMTLCLAKAGYKIVSIDKDKESLKIAAMNLAYEKLLSNVTFYVMDGKCLTFADDSFKNIVAVDMFHHIKERDKLFAEIDRVLCVGGKALLADFNEKGMAIIEDVHKGEGRIHESFGIARNHAYDYFYNLKYKIQSYDETHHWALIAQKAKKRQDDEK